MRIGAACSIAPAAVPGTTASCVGREILVSFRARFRRWFYHRAMRLFMLFHSVLLSLAKAVGRLRGTKPKAVCPEILLTGRFESDNWIISHLEPLAASRMNSRVWMVSTNPVPKIPNVSVIYPPGWLIRMVGRTAARLLVFVLAGLRKRPGIVGGFNMKPNAMAAAVVARLIGSRALYFCVGGPTEILEGGVWGEAGPFPKMETPDLVVERRFLRTVGECDLVVTMGTRAVRFFREKGINTNLQVLPGGIRDERFCPGEVEPSVDVVFVGRLAPVKRIDILLEAVRLTRDVIGDIRAVIVGSGELRESLEEVARKLGVDDCVVFAGHQKNVRQWLRKAKVFMLTSRTEGLSLALMEAMMCGLPGIVPRVGDLPDLVEDGVNGYLVEGHSPAKFAARMRELLANDEKRAAFSRAARSAAMRYETQHAVRRWDEVLSGG